MSSCSVKKNEKQRGDKNVVVNCWTKFTGLLHKAILSFVLCLSLAAARHPKRCIALIILISFSLVGIGFVTNFDLQLDDEGMYAPWTSISRDHRDYLKAKIPESNLKRRIVLVLHAQGGNVITYEGMRRLFIATDTIRNVESYEDVCGNDCPIAGPVIAWRKDLERFEDETQRSDQNVSIGLSQDSLGGVSEFIGNLKREITEYSKRNETYIVYGESLMTFMELPTLGILTEDFEVQVQDALLPLKIQWEEEDQPYRLEFMTGSSIADELNRSVSGDIKLLPMVFVVMSVFSCLVFGDTHPIKSRALLGVGSIISIVFSIMSGFGLCFIIGIPFTSQTQILPFVIFGVGMDDSFVITGEYFRTDPAKDPVIRVRETMQEVGASICLTTITTVVAFVLGATTSAIPCIQWLCIYGFPTFFLVLVYQLTFFVSIIVLDEQRIQANRRDCCICFKVKPDEEDADVEAVGFDSDDEEADDSSTTEPKAPLLDRIMLWYGKQLLRPTVKVIVIVFFVGYMVACAANIPNLSRSFSPQQLLPTDSYIQGFLSSLEEYTNRQYTTSIYFTEVDQSDPKVQDQMIQFIDDLANLTQVRHYNERCWVKDFQAIRDGTNPAFDQFNWIFKANFTFYEQLDMMLAIPEVNQVFGSSIIRDEETGEIVVSKCSMPVHYMDMVETSEPIAFLDAQREVSVLQPINRGRDQLAFFTFDNLYFVWEFFKQVNQELIGSAVTGVLAVCAIALMLIPHWTAVPFIFPLIVMLYLDLVGTMYFAGLSLNPLTYIILVMAIGMLVDFIMHVLLRYYESDRPTRQEKVLETLRTMGGSILLGGLSTVLGVVPLAFASSEIIGTVFVMFVALVVLGVTHGLIFLPVVLSYLGPEVCVTTSLRSKGERCDSRSITAASFLSQKDSTLASTTLASTTTSRFKSPPVSPVGSLLPSSPVTPVEPMDIITNMEDIEEVESSSTFKAEVPDDAISC